MNVKTLVTCVETGCDAGIYGIAVTPDLNYWDSPMHQEIIGKYPQPIKEVLLWDKIKRHKPVKPFGTCCRNLKW